MPHHVMLDLETLGKRAGCGVLSIGAREFVPYEDRIGRAFYEVVNRASCAKKGLTEDRETLDWWSRQSEEARQVLRDAENCPQGLGGALIKLTGWLQQFGKKELYIWGNGADFDQPILYAAFEACSMPVPWLFYNNRCYRTLRAFGNVKTEPPRHGVHHNALDDATTQAATAMRIIKQLALSV